MDGEVMAAMNGCSYCETGWKRWNDMSCSECSGENSRRSFDNRIGMLAGNLRVAALEELRSQCQTARLRAVPLSVAQQCGGPVQFAVRKIAEGLE